MRYFAFMIFMGIGLSWDQLSATAVCVFSIVGVIAGAMADSVD